MNDNSNNNQNNNTNNNNNHNNNNNNNTNTNNNNNNDIEAAHQIPLRTAATASSWTSSYLKLISCYSVLYYIT